ncbi:protein NnrT [Sulfitobacter sp. F26204]|uniref:protein NnrT n=1 Tax=Sulfitobacter sp. F26204 TaxID=2996014 RepID=UPI00225E5246|nr:protein NnrT [Sulfitobacter sp. F26204]MCX7560182.1 protein NnrT [Sulfitobacter sp. F26204]
MRYLTTLLLLLAVPAWGASYERPIPQVQSATAEMWFAIASLALIGALWLVHHLVMRK